MLSVPSFYRLLEKNFHNHHAQTKRQTSTFRIDRPLSAFAYYPFRKSAKLSRHHGEFHPRVLKIPVAVVHINDGKLL